MIGRLFRKEIAKRLGVTPNTIYRWEQRPDCPVRPKRLKRTQELIYEEEDVERYRAWMDELENARKGRGKKAKDQ